MPKPQELEKCEEISINKSFMEQTDCILRKVGEKSGNFLAVKELMIEKRHSEEKVQQELMKYADDFKKVRVRLKNILNHYIQKGIDENVITLKNEEVIKNTILMLFIGFIALQNCPLINEGEENHLPEQIETVKMMLLHSLHD